METQVIPGKPDEPLFPLTAFNDRPNCFDYGVRRVELANGQSAPDPQPAYGYEAILPYRQICWYGATEGEAMGAMLKGVAELARNGSLDPQNPYRRGVPTLQHAMAILTESLEWHLDRRREQLEFDSVGEPLSLTSERPQPSPQVGRLNEIISGLATSIAALARVKEL